MTAPARALAALLGVSLAAGSLAIGISASPSASGAAPSAAQPRNGVTPTATYAVIKTIPVGGFPRGLGIDQADDTVYVANYAPNNVSVINGRTGTVTDTVGVGVGPWAVAVDQGDDTVYVVSPQIGQPNGNVSVINGRTRAVVGAPLTVGKTPQAVAVNDGDDSVYVANYDSDSVAVINGRTLTWDDTITGFRWPTAVAVDQADDTVYAASLLEKLWVIEGGTTTPLISVDVSGYAPSAVAVNEPDDTVYTASSNGTVWVVNGRTAVADDSIPIGGTLNGVAVDQVDDTVYVTNETSDKVSVINGRSRAVDDSISVGSDPFGVAVDNGGTNRGLVFVSNRNSNTVSVIGRATPTLSPSLELEGATTTLTLTVPSLSSEFSMDDSTVTSVSFDGVPVPGVMPGAGNTWTMEVPAPQQGSPATVPVTVTFKGGLTASAGTFTYGSPTPPPPGPVYPPGAPTQVKAIAGDASAVVSWTAPTYSGSYPITDYQVTSSPGSNTCLVSAPTAACTVTGLANGTPYTFTARALNGAGWGAESGPSEAVSPSGPIRPSMLITGSRDATDPKMVRFIGTSRGLTGQEVTPYIRFPGQADYEPGFARPTVADDGTFSWQRRTNRKIYVYFATREVMSNRVIVPAR